MAKGKDKKYKSFHYRFVDGLGDGRTLEELVRSALFNTHTKVADRWEVLVGDDDNTTLRRFVNRRRQNNAMVFGELVLYEAGRNKEALTIAEDQEELPTEQITLSESADGHPREFSDSSLYFGIHRNHVILVQTQALTGRELENHLRWLIGEQALALEDGENIVLKRGLSLQGTRALQRVKSVSVGTPLFAESQEDGPPSDRGGAILRRSWGREILDIIFGEHELERLKLDQYGDADLVIELSIRRKGRTHDDEDNRERRAMEALTGALRHQHSGDVRIHSKLGKISGDEVYVTQKLGVVHWNGLPDIEDTFHQMQDWLMKCIKDGTVEPK